MWVKEDCGSHTNCDKLLRPKTKKRALMVRDLLTTAIATKNSQNPKQKGLGSPGAYIDRNYAYEINTHVLLNMAKERFALNRSDQECC